MNCPYTNQYLEQFLTVYSPVGQCCFECEDCGCKHNHYIDPEEILDCLLEEAKKKVARQEELL